MLFLLASLALAKKTPPPPPPTLDEVGAILIGQALTDDRPFEDLVWLADRIGPRPNGSAGLAAAVEWSQTAMTKAGLTARAEPVMLPTWSRGEATADLLAPVAKALHPLALGGSVGTNGTIEAEVLVVGSWADLAAHADQAKGKIVVWDVPFAGYGETVGYRFAGASEAAKVGAVASLVRSVSPVSLQSPHTGTQAYQDGVAQIPALAITIEDATLLHRLQDRGETPRIRLSSTSAVGDEKPSANVVGHLEGREIPQERVILGCHLDSWDVGTGAQDDGAGCAVVLGAARLIAEQPVKPRRSVEVVFFVGEEYKVAGARGFAAAHEADAQNIVAALECDTGAGQPLGFGLQLRGADEDHPLEADDPTVMRVIERLRPVSELLVPIGAGSLEVGHSGTDVEPLVAFGVPGLGMHQDTTNYWPIHHTAADTVDKVDPVLLAKNTAAMAVMVWALADMPERIDR
jgi:carboxypeptidase Q